MTERKPLPPSLTGRSFGTSTAGRAGASRSRLRSSDLQRPWTGVRSRRIADSTLERSEDYAPRLRPGQFFTHGTASVLLGLPVPFGIEEDELVHVGAVRPGDAPHARGTTGHRSALEPPLVTVAGLPVVAADEVFCQLGATLGLEDLVVVADHLLNTTSLGEEEAKAALLARIGVVRRVGGARLVRAVQAGRRGSGSPGETRLRLALDAGGVPPAELNTKLFDARGRYLGKPDFTWRRERVLLEHGGDGHREREQFRRDIVRYEDFADEGWRVLRSTADDLTATGRRRLARRVLAALG